MNCTNKQQETAECEKRGCKGCYYNEKSADEMFKELGTNKTDNIDFCVYEGKNIKSNRILFNKVMKSIIFEGFNAFGMQELQAINKKCEELKWI